MTSIELIELGVRIASGVALLMMIAFVVILVGAVVSQRHRQRQQRPRRKLKIRRYKKLSQKQQ
jgi:hypothetical protein